MLIKTTSVVNIKDMKDYIKSTHFLTRLVVFILIIFVFNSAFGIEIINPTNINWIMSARHDWGTHYLGWAFYRDEPWTFPLGEMESVNYPIGTNVGLFDNIPGMCTLLKVFSPILPENFQFLGFWLLFCQLMAAHFTIKIFNLYNTKTILVILATLLIACNPVLIYRGIHAALSAHFLIIASIYFYLKPATAANIKSINRSQLLVFIASALINPYLCFMIAGFNVILPMKQYFYDKLISLKQLIIYPIISILSVIVVWIIIGMITFGDNAVLEVSDSYKLYGFNLNSVFNSGGFSRYLPAMPYVNFQQYEGYLYAGLGMLLLIVLSLLYFFITKKRRSFRKANKYLLPLFIFLIAATLFAISNRVTYNDHVLLKYDIPGIISKLGNTFRACGRVIWIPYYAAILFFTLIFIKSKVATWVKAVLLVFFIFLQGHDLTALYIRESLPYGDYDSPLSEEKWNAVIPSFDAMITYPPHNNHLLNQMDYQDLSFMALKNHKPISMGYTAREDLVNKQKYLDSLTVLLQGGNFSSDELYITTQEHLGVFSALLQDNKLALEYLDGYYLLYDIKKQDEIKFNSGTTILYKTASEKVYSKSKSVKSQYADSLYNDKLTFKLDQLIANESSIITTGSVFMENALDSKQDSVFVTVSDGSKVFITQTRQIQLNTPDKRGLGFSSVVLTNGFTNQDDLILGVAVKKHSGGWIYNKIGKLSETNKTTKSVKKDQLPAQKAQIGVVDEFVDKNRSLQIRGWTIFKDADAADNEIEVVFVGSNEAYIFPAEPVERPDVTQYYNDGYNYDNSGYEVLINKKDIPQGNYKIGLLVRNKSNGEESLMMTDKTFIKK